MTVKLNNAGKSHAIALINSGKVDKDSSWSMSADDENNILGDNNWTEYGKWHLGVDDSSDKATKAHYKYPFGKGGKVYRSALTAVRQRAGQQGADDIFKAAGSMLEKIDGKKEGNTIKPELEKRERRTFSINEIRISIENEKPVLRGHAAVFNSMSADLGIFMEIIKPNAFRAALTSSDPRCLFNHDASRILGRRSAGTLRLQEDEKGLPFECDLPGTTYANDLQISMSRGDIRECSFGFSVREGGDTWQKQADGMWLRTICEDGIEELYDVSPVTYPAYADTSCAIRSLGKIMEAEKPPFDDTAIRRMRVEIESVL